MRIKRYPEIDPEKDILSQLETGHEYDILQPE